MTYIKGKDIKSGMTVRYREGSKFPVRVVQPVQEKGLLRLVGDGYAGNIMVHEEDTLERVHPYPDWLIGEWSCLMDTDDDGSVRSLDKKTPLQILLGYLHWEGVHGYEAKITEILSLKEGQR